MFAGLQWILVAFKWVSAIMSWPQKTVLWMRPSSCFIKSPFLHYDQRGCQDSEGEPTARVSWIETRAPTSWVISTTNYCSPRGRLFGSSHSEEGSSCCEKVNNLWVNITVVICNQFLSNVFVSTVEFLQKYDFMQSFKFVLFDMLYMCMFMIYSFYLFICTVSQ